MGPGGSDKSSAGIGAAFGTTATTEELLDGCTEKLDVFSYHYYNGISERLAAVSWFWMKQMPCLVCAVTKLQSVSWNWLLPPARSSFCKF